MLNARRAFAWRAYLFSLCFLFFYLFLLSRGGGEEYMHKLNHPVRYGERRLDYHYDNQYLCVIPFKLRPATTAQSTARYTLNGLQNLKTITSPEKVSAIIAIAR